MSHKTEDIRSKPSNKAYRKNYDRIFKKAGVAQQAEQPPCKRSVDGSIPSTGSRIDENIDWGDFKTWVCVNNDPNFGG